jgi:hypothetical protein
VRESANGGKISVNSGRTNGVAINVSSSAQLLSLLHDAPVAQSGRVELRATGAASQIQVNGTATAQPARPTIAADSGNVEIRNTGGGGGITINDALIRGDVLKVGALASDGTLTLNGGSVLNGTTQVLLYAGTSTGSISVVGTVTVNNPGTTVLQADKINVKAGGALNVAGGGVGKLNLFANVREWGAAAGFGVITLDGQDVPSTTGSFIGGRATVDPAAGGPNGGIPPGF